MVYFTALPPFLQFPVGRRAACDIYWHGVSFHDNENIVSGQVNKFPGISPPVICSDGFISTHRTSFMCTYYSIITSVGEIQLKP